MTKANFKAWVYGFIDRTSATFTTAETASIDQVDYAMVNAIRAAQREYSFELARTDAFLTTSEIGANWMTGCKTTPGGATTVLMKRIDSAYNYNTSTVPAGTLYSRSSKIDLGTTGDFKRELPTDGGALQLDQQQLYIARRKFIYFNGQNLHITTVGTATPILLNGIKFIDTCTDDDIFLTYFTDWFFWATLIHLNQFLKDDQRISIDNAFVTKLWQSVKEMDGQIANMGDSASLN